MKLDTVKSVVVSSKVVESATVVKDEVMHGTITVLTH